MREIGEADEIRESVIALRLGRPREYPSARSAFPHPMPGNKNLQISSNASGAPLTPDRKRFNTLVRQIAQARQTHADWQENIPLFGRMYTKVVVPLRASFAEVCRKIVFALDALLDQPGWSRPERTALREILCEGAGQLLAVNAEDDALRAVFDKHSDIDFATGRQQEFQDFKELTEHFTGIDLGDIEGIQSDDELAQRMFEQMAAKAAAEDAKRTARAQRKGKTAAQKKREDEAQLATQSVREIYRKLASAVHPDREPDPVLRAARTTLMQKINQAYAANDLLTLLEIQLQIEQVDATHIENLSAQRLKHYNKVLAEQLAGLKQEIARVESGFCLDYGIEPLRSMNARKLGGFIQEQAGALRAVLAQQQSELRVLADRAAARRWLKRQRRPARRGRYDDEDFY